MHENQPDDAFGSPDKIHKNPIPIPIPGGGGIVYVTQDVYLHFVTPVVGPLLATIDLTPLIEAICALLEVEPKSGWRIGVYQGKILWLVQNQLGTRTLMFPKEN